MNCKPGDLAVIVKTIDGFEWALGRIVRCIRRAPPSFSVSGEYIHDAWYIEEMPGPGGIYDRVSDHHLRPIRDPGDDAVDEMLRPLPADLVPA